MDDFTLCSWRGYGVNAWRVEAYFSGIARDTWIGLGPNGLMET